MRLALILYLYEGIINMHFEAIKNSIDIKDVAKRYGIVVDRNNKALCFVHNDTRPSLSFKGGRYKCFACGVGGDVIDMVAAIQGVSAIEAARMIDSHYRLNLFDVTASPEAKHRQQETKAKAEAKKAPEKNVDFVIPVPGNAPPVPDTINELCGVTSKWIKTKIDHYYAYRTESGELIGYAVRADTKDGKKLGYKTLINENGALKWSAKSFPKPRPLYGLDLLAKKPLAKVLMVEGEKCADAANRKLGNKNWVAMAWPGGSQAVKYADFAPLIGRDCTCWPDNDAAGRKAMSEVSAQLDGIPIMHIPDGYPAGWDVADAGAVTDIDAFITDCVTDCVAICSSKK